MNRICIFVLFFIALLPVSGNDTAIMKRVYYAERLVGEAPVIDGQLNDSCWRVVEYHGNFIQQAPNEGKSPTKPTTLRIMYDNDNLYVAIYCYDDKDKIRNVFSQRDQFAGDVTGIALDSYFNQQTAYEFNLTSAGQKIDLMHLGNSTYDFNWNANWEGKTALADSGWVAEFRIPFSQIRYTDKDEQTWGMHVWRWIDRVKEESQWKLIPLNAPAGVHNFGELHGISHIRNSRQAELLPFVSARLENNGQNENPYVDNLRFMPNAGLDAKIGISSNFTLDATINPDFGQVEADPSQLNLTAYETYFDEKRPFFLEGQEIFDFKMNDNPLFYSRRIGAKPSYYPDVEDNEEYEHPENTTILASGKITGRTSKGLSVGILETITSPEFGNLFTYDSLWTLPSDTMETKKIKVQPFTNYFAARIKKQSAGANTTLGFSFNSVLRNLNSPELVDEFASSAHTAGLDYNQFLKNKRYYIQSNFLGSTIQGSGAAMTEIQRSHIHRFQRQDAPHLKVDSSLTTLSGTGGLLEFGKRGGKFRFGVNGSYWSPGLNFNDVGFMSETDFIEQKSWIRINLIEPKSFYRSINWYLNAIHRWSFGKEHLKSGFYTELNSTLKNLWDIYISGEYYYHQLDSRILRGGPALYTDPYAGGGIWVQTNSAKKFYGGTQYFHYYSWGNKGTYDDAGLRFTLNPIDKLRISSDLLYVFKNFGFEYFPQQVDDREDIYLMGRMHQKILSITLRAEYYFTPEISVQYYGNPYFSTVDYLEFRKVINSKATNINERFYFFSESELQFNPEDNTIQVNEISGDSYEFENPDVSFGEFRSNFVFRWEYKLGSVFYLVWSHNQGKYDNIDRPQMNRTVDELFQESSGDVIMAKLSYWFNI